MENIFPSIFIPFTEGKKKRYLKDKYRVNLQHQEIGIINICISNQTCAFSFFRQHQLWFNSIQSSQCSNLIQKQQIQLLKSKFHPISFKARNNYEAGQKFEYACILSYGYYYSCCYYLERTRSTKTKSMQKGLRGALKAAYLLRVLHVQVRVADIEKTEHFNFVVYRDKRLLFSNESI